MSNHLEARKSDRQIVGISLAPQLAREVKAEAGRRGLSLRALFEEIWEKYQDGRPDKARP
jgi:hypothetical protein